jgi:DNA-binding MarR family transcriptional regulator
MYDSSLSSYKLSASEHVAHSPLPTSAKMILHIIALSRYGISPAEIVRRTNIPRRTVFYWLRKLLREGMIERKGKARSPDVIYTITRHGLRYLRWLSCCTVSKRAVTSKLKIPIWVVIDGNNNNEVEVGVRMHYPSVRRFLQSLGIKMPRHRVKALIIYAARYNHDSFSKVHVDAPISVDALSMVDDVTNLTMLVQQRYWLAFISVTAILIALGLRKDLLKQIVDSVESEFIVDVPLTPYLET